MRIRTPARPSSKLEVIPFKIGIENLVDTSNRRVFIPVIQFHINPTSINFQYKKIITRQRTRGGWIEEHWGDELDVVNIEASTGSFLSLETGLNVTRRHETLSMINFQEILAIYKNNACVYDNLGNIVNQGDVFIEYDTYKLFGQFQSFNWDETIDNPFRYVFNFAFEVKRTQVIV
jgi:hypothetical protein